MPRFADSSDLTYCARPGRRFAGAIGAVSGHGDPAKGRQDVDDGAAAVAGKDGREGLADRHRPEKIGLEFTTGALGGIGTQYRTAQVDAGVVDDDGDVARGGGGGDVGGAGHIEA